jgi:hypothetical protein
MLPNFSLTELLEIGSLSVSNFPVPQLLQLGTVCKFCTHQIVISITICCQETLDMKYAQMPSPVCRVMINLIVSHHVRGGSGVYA